MAKLRRVFLFQGAERIFLSKVIAVIPVFNEARTLPDILPRVAAGVDILVCVNDGSRDRSQALLENFAMGRKGVYLVDLPSNQGMAGALKQGFLFVLFLRSLKVIADGDLVATIDADGQHKPEYIPELSTTSSVRGQMWS